MVAHQMDVITAFLRLGVLDEEIYMVQPPGYITDAEEDLVCKLKRSLHGIKQSPRCCNTLFTAFTESASFEQSSADPCLHIHCKGADLAIIAVYVDDLIIVAKSQEMMSKIKCDLSRQFKLGKFTTVWGLPQTITNRGYILYICLQMHHGQCIHKRLEKYGLSEAKPSTTLSEC